jgi:hypothetical protein
MSELLKLKTERNPIAAKNKNAGFRRPSETVTAAKENVRPNDLQVSVAKGTSRREKGIAEKTRNKISQGRDQRVNLGVGKPSSVVTD